MSRELEPVDGATQREMLASYRSAVMLHQRNNWSGDLARLHRIEEAAAQLIGAMNYDRGGPAARSLSIAHAKDMLEAALRKPR